MIRGGNFRQRAERKGDGGCLARIQIRQEHASRVALNEQRVRGGERRHRRQKLHVALVGEGDGQGSGFPGGDRLFQRGAGSQYHGRGFPAARDGQDGKLVGGGGLRFGHVVEVSEFQVGLKRLGRRGYGVRGLELYFDAAGLLALDGIEQEGVRAAGDRQGFRGREGRDGGFELEVAQITEGDGEFRFLSRFQRRLRAAARDEHLRLRCGLVGFFVRAARLRDRQLNQLGHTGVLAGDLKAQALPGAGIFHAGKTHLDHQRVGAFRLLRDLDRPFGEAVNQFAEIVLIRGKCVRRKGNVLHGDGDIRRGAAPQPPGRGGAHGKAVAHGEERAVLGQFALGKGGNRESEQKQNGAQKRRGSFKESGTHHDFLLFVSSLTISPSMSRTMRSA